MKKAPRYRNRLWRVYVPIFCALLVLHITRIAIRGLIVLDAVQIPAHLIGVGMIIYAWRTRFAE